MSERSVYLGKNTAGELVFADVRIEPASDEEVTFTDHSTGGRPATVGISFTLIDARPGVYDRPLSQINDRHWISGGQTPADERVIPNASDDVRTVERLWETAHLNTLNAACDHMTSEMTARLDGESTTEWQHRMLDTVVCPETGYRWGHAWLARRVDKDDLLQLMSAVARLPRKATR